MPQTSRLPLRGVLAGIAFLAQAAHGADAPPEEQKVGPTAFNQKSPEPVDGWGIGDGKSYWVPAADILLFEAAMNAFNRAYIDETTYGTSWSTFEDHLKGRWVFDNDPFTINQFGHPYQGSMYHGFARSAGLGYWSALGYTMFGSLMWELGGETTLPSINDQFTTGIGGTFLGEPLFRLASLALESHRGPMGFWRELGTAFISPATGFNRTVYGSRFDGVFESHSPAVYTRYQLGANLNATVHSDVPASQVPTSFQRGEAVSDFTVAYGMPGKPGYTYDRPFDYFHFQFTAASGNVLENVITRGLLYGTDYGVGDHYRGIWGLYGTYDYIAPQIFRVSTTGLALGTTGQWWTSPATALQCEFLAGAGYGSGGVVTDAPGARNYHNGVTPQSMLSLRWILRDRAALEMTARDYYVSDLASDEKGGSENISRGDAGITLRVWGLHGVTLKYVITHRDAHYETQPDTRQTVGAISLGYTYLGHRWFGAVDWRDDAQDNKTLSND